MSDLKVGLQQTPGEQSDLEAELIATSPLRAVDPASIDELLERVNEHLIAGVPNKLRENDDELLRRLVDGFRREAIDWATAERTKKPRAPRGEKKAVDLNLAMDL
jgi:hypothetical protein